MRLPIKRYDITILPDPKRVIAKFFFNGEERAKNILNHIKSLSDSEVYELISPILQEFSKRHRNIKTVAR